MYREKFTGNMTIYRRAEDAAMWESFQRQCFMDRMPVSAAIARLVDQYLSERRGMEADAVAQALPDEGPGPNPFLP